MSDYRCNVPVAMLVFNRPDTTKQVLRAVARARPARLLVCADGPRADRPDDVAACAATRALFDAIDWPCRVSTRFLSSNEGIGKGMWGGIDWVFSQTDEAILLEDDCVPRADFFPFCEKMLERHRGDERISMVRGSCFPAAREDLPASYRFSRFHAIWGWAGWSRAWKHFDSGMKEWPALRASGFVERHATATGTAFMLKALLDLAYSGRLATWDLRWWYSCWRRDTLAITPNRNLVANIGMGPDATHYVREGIASTLLGTPPMPWPLRHPDAVVADTAADNVEWAHMRQLMTRPPAALRAA